MSSAETIPDQVLADEDAVNEHVLTGKPLAPDVYRRVRSRAEKITAEIRQKYGVLDIAGDLVRETRDE